MKQNNETNKSAIDAAIINIMRLNRLRIKNKLHRDTWQEFFTYKNILIANDNGTYADDVKAIIYNK